MSKTSLSNSEACGIVLSLQRRGRIIGSAAVLKTAARKGLQVRVLSPPPINFNHLHLQ